jgi:hypothetical protein
MIRSCAPVRLDWKNSALRVGRTSKASRNWCGGARRHQSQPRSKGLVRRADGSRHMAARLAAGRTPRIFSRTRAEDLRSSPSPPPFGWGGRRWRHPRAHARHGGLELAWREDDSRRRKGPAAAHCSRSRPIAVNWLTQEITSRHGVRVTRHRAGWDHDSELTLWGIEMRLPWGYTTLGASHRSGERRPTPLSGSSSRGT